MEPHEKYITKIGRKWQVRISGLDGPTCYVGTYHVLAEAIEARNKKLIDVFGNIDRIKQARTVSLIPRLAAGFEFKEPEIIERDLIQIEEVTRKRYSNPYTVATQKNKLKTLYVLLIHEFGNISILNNPKVVTNFIDTYYSSPNERQVYARVAEDLAGIFFPENVPDYKNFVVGKNLEYASQIPKGRKNSDNYISYDMIREKLAELRIIPYPDRRTLVKIILLAINSSIPLRKCECAKIILTRRKDFNEETFNFRKFNVLIIDDLTYISKFHKTTAQYGTRNFRILDLEEYQSYLEQFLAGSEGTRLFEHSDRIGPIISEIFDRDEIPPPGMLRKAVVSEFVDQMTLENRAKLAWAMGHSIDAQINFYKEFQKSGDFPEPNLSGVMPDRSLYMLWTRKIGDLIPPEFQQFVLTFTLGEYIDLNVPNIIRKVILKMGNLEKVKDPILIQQLFASGWKHAGFALRMYHTLIGEEIPDTAPVIIDPPCTN